MGPDEGGCITKEHKKRFGGGGVLVISMLVMVSRVYTYVKDHQIIFQIGAVYHILNIL